MRFHLYNFNNSCKELIFFFSPIEILFGLRNIGLLFTHTVLLVFGDSIPVCLYLPLAAVPPRWQRGPGDWNVDPTHPIDRLYFLSS